MEKNVNNNENSNCDSCNVHCSKIENLNSEGTKNFMIVKFKRNRTDVFINYKNIKLFNGDYAIVTAEAGIDFGLIVHTFQSTEEEVEKKYNCSVNKTIVRRGFEKDLEKLYLNREEEKNIIEKASIIAQSYGLEMKIIDVEWQFDKHKLSVFFTAPQRVDFRELVKDLARQFKSRIELRQINTRDEIAMLGESVGCCGRPICCNTFSLDYNKTTLEHIKLQKLSTNASKLSGNCMRLKCCMTFEYEFYEKELAKYPTLHSTIIKANNEYKLNKINIFKQEVTLYNSKDKSYQIMNNNELEQFLKGANVIKPVSIESEIIAEEDIIIDD